MLSDEEKTAFEADLSAVLNAHGIDGLTGCTDTALTEFITECLYTYAQTISGARLEMTGPKGTAYVRINPALPPTSPPAMLQDQLTYGDTPDGDEVVARKLADADLSTRTPHFPAGDARDAVDPRDVPPGY